MFLSLLALGGLAAFSLLSETIYGRLLDTSVSCDQANFVLSLNFDSLFTGIVYSEEGFPNCVYVNGTMLSHKSYQLKIPLFGCETHVNSEGNYENAIIIQENAAFLQATDKKYMLTCIPASASPVSSDGAKDVKNDFNADPSGKRMGDNAMITVDFGGVTVENTHTTTEVIRGHLPPSINNNNGPSAADLKYNVEIRAGHSLDSPSISNALNIGDPITYMVRLQKPVATSQLGRCWASDAKSQLELADERGCSLQPRGNIWGPFEKIENDREVIFLNRIKAWAFPTSNEVNIFCNLRICMSRYCSFSNCSVEPSLAGESPSSNQLPQRHRREGRIAYSLITSNYGQRKNRGELDEIEPLQAARIRLRRQPAAGNTEISASVDRLSAIINGTIVGKDDLPLNSLRSPLILSALVALALLLFATFIVLLALPSAIERLTARWRCRQKREMSM